MSCASVLFSDEIVSAAAVGVQGGSWGPGTQLPQSPQATHEGRDEHGRDEQPER